LSYKATVTAQSKTKFGMGKPSSRSNPVSSTSLSLEHFVSNSALCSCCAASAANFLCKTQKGYSRLLNTGTLGKEVWNQAAYKAKSGSFEHVHALADFKLKPSQVEILVGCLNTLQDEDQKKVLQLLLHNNQSLSPEVFRKFTVHKHATSALNFLASHFSSRGLVIPDHLAKFSSETQGLALHLRSNDLKGFLRKVETINWSSEAKKPANIALLVKAGILFDVSLPSLEGFIANSKGSVRKLDEVLGRVALCSTRSLLVSEVKILTEFFKVFSSRVSDNGLFSLALRLFLNNPSISSRHLFKIARLFPNQEFCFANTDSTRSELLSVLKLLASNKDLPETKLVLLSKKNFDATVMFAYHFNSSVKFPSDPSFLEQTKFRFLDCKVRNANLLLKYFEENSPSGIFVFSAHSYSSDLLGSRQSFASRIIEEPVFRNMATQIEKYLAHDPALIEVVVKLLLPGPQPLSVLHNAAKLL